MTPSITCPRCGATSYHPGDLAAGYCGRCHWWTSDPTLGQPWVIAQAERDGALQPLRTTRRHPLWVFLAAGIASAGLYGLGQDLGLYDVAGIADLVVTIVVGYAGMFAAAIAFDWSARR